MTKAKEKKVLTKRVNKSPWYSNLFFRYIIGTILILAALYMISLVFFLISPIISFTSTLIAPILISLLLYYVFRPIVYFAENYRIPRVVTITVIYLVLFFLFILFAAYLLPILGDQIKAIANTSVDVLNSIQKTRPISIGPFLINWETEIQQRIVGFMQQATALLSQNLLELIGIVTRIASILVVIPFILYYLLRQDQLFSATFLDSIPGNFGIEVKKILNNIDSTLASYITSLVLISLSVGGLLFIGYLIIGLQYALVLSIIALIFTTIPFLGPFIAITPALLVGLSVSPLMTLKVVVVFIIVEQIEGNIISPQIIGQRLHIHPLTIILLLLAAGTLYGLIGLILATPLYAVCKVLLENLLKIYRLRFPKFKEKIEE